MLVGHGWKAYGLKLFGSLHSLKKTTLSTLSQCRVQRRSDSLSSLVLLWNLMRFEPRLAQGSCELKILIVQVLIPYFLCVFFLSVSTWPWDGFIHVRKCHLEYVSRALVVWKQIRLHRHAIWVNACLWWWHAHVLRVCASCFSVCSWCSEAEGPCTQH